MHLTMGRMLDFLSGGPKIRRKNVFYIILDVLWLEQFTDIIRCDFEFIRSLMKSEDLVCGFRWEARTVHAEVLS